MITEPDFCDWCEVSIGEYFYEVVLDGKDGFLVCEKCNKDQMAPWNQ